MIDWLMDWLTDWLLIFPLLPDIKRSSLVVAIVQNLLDADVRVGDRDLYFQYVNKFSTWPTVFVLRVSSRYHGTIATLCFQYPNMLSALPPVYFACLECVVQSDVLLSDRMIFKHMCIYIHRIQQYIQGGPRTGYCKAPPLPPTIYFVLRAYSSFFNVYWNHHISDFHPLGFVNERRHNTWGGIVYVCLLVWFMLILVPPPLPILAKSSFCSRWCAFPLSWQTASPPDILFVFLVFLWKFLRRVRGTHRGSMCDSMEGWNYCVLQR